MKTIIKLWATSKKSMMFLIIWIMLSATYSYICTKLVIVINDAVVDPENILYGIMVVGGFTFAKIVSEALAGFCKRRASSGCYNYWCNKLADKLLDVDVDFYTKYSCSYIATVQEMLHELVDIGILIAACFINVFAILITIYSIIGVAGWLVFPVIIVYVCMVLFAKYTYPMYNEIEKRNAEIARVRNQDIENINYGFMEVRSFRKEEFFRNKIHSLNNERHSMNLKKTKLNTVIQGGFTLLDFVALVITMFICAKMIVRGDMVVTSAITTVMLVFRIMQPLVILLDMVDEYSAKVKHAEDFDRVMSYHDPEKSGMLTISGFDKEIEFKDVSFAYGDSKDTLKSISLKIRKGEKIGVCGESGGGKTTVFKLINKFYKPQDGKILIDGTNIWDLSNNSYRSLIGSVHQENIMFPGTIYENIVYGKQNVLECEVVEVCKKAHIYDFIQSLPERFDTQIGPRGLMLSVGQKQRIALARLLLVDPEIILLDEATSALDNETEEFIQDAIQSLEGKTIITIAHRLSTIWDSDKIYVIGNHNIVEEGTHEELMNLQGIYYNMNKRKEVI